VNSGDLNELVETIANTFDSDEDEDAWYRVSNGTIIGFETYLGLPKASDPLSWAPWSWYVHDGRCTNVSRNESLGKSVKLM
jgi:hypothetical protein